MYTEQYILTCSLYPQFVKKLDKKQGGKNFHIKMPELLSNVKVQTDKAEDLY